MLEKPRSFSSGGPAFAPTSAKWPQTSTKDTGPFFFLVCLHAYVSSRSALFLSFSFLSGVCSRCTGAGVTANFMPAVALQFCFFFTFGVSVDANSQRLSKLAISPSRHRFDRLKLVISCCQLRCVSRSRAITAAFHTGAR